MYRFLLISIAVCLPGVVTGTLLLTEVFFDGSDERVEITNASEELFSGTVQLSGVKSQSLDLSLVVAGGESVLIGDQGAMLAGPTGHFISGRGLQISDTQAITITLSYSGAGSPDIFTVSAADVAVANNQKASFARTCRPDRTDCTILLSSLDDATNILPGFIGTPREVLIKTPDVATGTSTGPYIQELYPAGSSGYILFTENLQTISGSVWWENTVDILDIVSPVTDLLVVVDIPLSGGKLSLLDKSGHPIETIFYPTYQSGVAWRYAYSSGEIRYFETPGSPLFKQVTSGGSSQEGDPPEFTGKYCDMCGPVDPGDSDAEESLVEITISEIFPYDIYPYSEYIELYFGTPYSGELIIGGLGHGSASKSFFVQASSGQRVVVTDTLTGIFNELSVVLLPAISLTDGGEQLEVYGHHGQLIDRVVYFKGNKGSSLYFSQLSGTRLFEESDLPTPGISRNFLGFLLGYDEQQVVSCGIFTQNKAPFYSHHKINLQAVYNNKKLTNATSYTCDWSFGDTTNYVSTDCNPGYYEYTTGGIYQVDLTIHEGETPVCSTQMTINYPHGSKSAGVGREGYYQGLYHKRKGRFDYLRKEVKRLGYTTSSSGEILTQQAGPAADLVEQTPLTGTLLIEQVLPNPSGPDQHKEGIRLKNLSSERVELTDLYLFNGKSKKKLPDVTIPAGETVDYQGTFGLTNKKTCVQLHDATYLYDLFCYQTPVEGVRYTGEHLGLEYMAEAPRMQRVSLKERDGKVCLIYKYDQIDCLDISTLGAITKLQKTHDRLQVKLDKELENVTKQKEKYTNEKKKRSEQRKKFEQQRKDLRADSAYYQRIARLSEAYQRLLDEQLNTHRQVVYRAEQVRALRGLYWHLKQKLQRRQDYTLGTVQIDADDLATIYLWEQQVVPLDQVDVRYLYETISSDLQPYIDTLRETSRLPFTTLGD